MNNVLEWVAMAGGIAGAITVSLDLGRRITGYGFIIFLVSSVAWVFVGIGQGEAPLTIQNVILSAVNVLGIYRWLIAKKEDG